MRALACRCGHGWDHTRSWHLLDRPEPRCAAHCCGAIREPCTVRRPPWLPSGVCIAHLLLLLHSMLACTLAPDTNAAFHACLCSCSTADIDYCSTADTEKCMFVITALLHFSHCLAEMHSRSCTSAVTQLHVLQYTCTLIATCREIVPRLH